jgi:hypothetical protein
MLIGFLRAKNKYDWFPKVSTPTRFDEKLCDLGCNNTVFSQSDCLNCA